MDQHEATWIDPTDGIEYRLRFDLDGSRVAAFAVETDAPAGVQFTALRRMRPSDHVEAIRRDRLEHTYHIPPGASVEDATGRTWTAHGSQIEVSVPVPEGMRRKTVERAARAASHYRNALNVGLDRPRKYTIEKLREDVGDPELPEKTVDNWIRSARKLGLLPATTQGRSV